MNDTTWNNIATAPRGTHPHDKYIRVDKCQNSTKPYFMPDRHELKDLRFVTSEGKLRQLIGTSAKVTKDIVRNGEKLNYEVREMFLSPSREMFLHPSVVFPADGWLPYSTASHKIKGIPKSPLSDFGEPTIEFEHESSASLSMCGMEGVCAKTCISMTGNLVMDSSLRSRYCKSWFWRTCPIAFLRLLIQEILDICRLSKAEKVYFRLNGTSDIMWEKYIDMDGLVEVIPKLGGFSDYTKHAMWQRYDENFPKNYRITFSVDEKPKSLAMANTWMLHGHGCSIVCNSFKKKKDDAIMALINDYTKVIDGDLDDARFADPPGAMVLLRNKGPLKSCTLRKNGSQSGLIMPTTNIIRFAQEQYRAGK